MARIRSLKPEFWDDRKLARSASRDARMLYMGLWNQADEHSRLIGDSLWIKGRVFPYDEDLDVPAIEKLLDELESAGRIRRYDDQGDPFIYLPKLDKHQRLDPRVSSRLPAPPCNSEDTDNNSSMIDTDKSARHTDKSTLSYVAGSMEQVAGSREHGGRARTDARGTRIPDDWMPSSELIDKMRAEGVPDVLARRELPKFRDYWGSKAGATARKVDWDATWRNWLRRAYEESRPPPSANVSLGPASTKAAEWLELGRELEGRSR